MDIYHIKDICAQLQTQLGEALQSSISSSSPLTRVAHKASSEPLDDETSFVMVDLEEAEELFDPVEVMSPTSETDDDAREFVVASSSAAQFGKGYAAALGRLIFSK